MMWKSFGFFNYYKVIRSIMHLNFKKQKIFHFYVNESFQLPLLIPIKEKSFKIVSQPFFLNEGSYMVCFEVDGEEQSMNDKIKSFVVLLLYCKCNPIQQSNDKWTMVDGLFFFLFHQDCLANE